MCSGPKNPQILTFNHLNMIIILSLKIIADNNKKKKGWPNTLWALHNVKNLNNKFAWFFKIWE